MGRSDFLFVMPGMLNGAARTVDLAGLFDSGSYNESFTPDEADARAIANDWSVIGNDLVDALRAVKSTSSRR